MTDKVRWGVIGCGGIARRRTIPEGIVPAANTELASVYDINEQICNEVAKQFAAKPAGDVQEMLKSEIDAVYIATPAHLHFGQAVACADTGKHTLCEKPLGMDLGQAEKMISTFKDSQVLLGTGFMMRFHSQHQAALNLIREGRLGKCVYGRAQLSCWYPPIEGAWRQEPKFGGGGSLMDMGGHCIDLLEMFFGNVTKVSCFINNSVQKYASEDSATVLLSFENGAMGTVDTFFCIPDNSSKNVLELYGSKGSILAEGTIGQGDAGKMTAYLEGEEKGYEAQQARSAEEGNVISPPPVNTYKAEIEEFSQAILEKREPLNGALPGLRSQKILGACYESTKTGRAVDII